jgi:hypothetical protein
MLPALVVLKLLVMAAREHRCPARRQVAILCKWPAKNFQIFAEEPPNSLVVIVEEE